MDFTTSSLNDAGSLLLSPVTPSYVVRATPDHGLGLFATVDITRGELIMTERPLLQINENPSISWVLSQIKALDAVSRTAFDALCHISGKDPQASNTLKSLWQQLSFCSEDDRNAVCKVSTNAYSVSGGMVVGEVTRLVNLDCIHSYVC